MSGQSKGKQSKLPLKMLKLGENDPRYDVCAGVGYLLSPASTLAFGQLENEFIVDFEEAKTDTSTLEMLIKGMASQSSQEVRDQFDL